MSLCRPTVLPSTERLEKLIFILLLSTHATFIFLGTSGLLDDLLALIVTGLAGLYLGVLALQRRRDKPLLQSGSMIVLVGAAAAMVVMTLLTYIYYGRLLEDPRHVAWITITLGMVTATGLTVTTRFRLHLLLMEFLLLMLVASVVGMVETALYEPQPGDPPSWQRVDGFTSLSIFSCLICIVVPMAFAAFLYNRDLGLPRLWQGKERILYLGWVAVLLALTAALVGNGSRGAMLGAGVGMLVATAFSLRHAPARQHAVLMGTLMGAFVLLLLFSRDLLGFSVPIVREGNNMLRPASASIAARTELVDDSFKHAFSNLWPIDPALVPRLGQQQVIDSPQPIIGVEEVEVDGQPAVRLTARPPAGYRGFASAQWHERTEWGEEEAFVRLPGAVDDHLVVTVPPVGRRVMEVWVVYEEGVFGRSPRILVRRAGAGAVGVDVLGIRSGEIGISLATHQPHNQLLAILVRYGFLGAALLVVFYGTVAVVLARAVLAVRTTADARVFFPVAAVASGIVAYWVIGLVNPPTPLTDHWYFGFLFACAPLVALPWARGESG